MTEGMNQESESEPTEGTPAAGVPTLSIPFNARYLASLPALSLLFIAVGAWLLIEAPVTRRVSNPTFIRIVGGFLLLMGVYALILGIAQSVKFMRGRPALAMDQDTLTINVAAIWTRSIPVDRIASVDTTSRLIIVVGEDGKKLYVPVKALASERSAEKLAFMLLEAKAASMDAPSDQTTEEMGDTV